MNYERRICEYTVAQVRQTDEGLTEIRGTAAVFNELSDPIFGFREIIEPGSFADALVGADTRALIDHVSYLLMGRTKSILLPNGKHTLELWEDEKGLQSLNYAPDPLPLPSIVESIRRRDISQMSFQFDVPPGGDHWEGTPDEPLHVISRVDPLADVSYVTFAAYPQTSVDLRTLMGVAGIDYENVREVVARGRLDKGLKPAETELIERARKSLEALTRAGSGDALRGVAGDLGAQGRDEVEWYRAKLQNIRAALDDINGR